jgi:hypothetical protein
VRATPGAPRQASLAAWHLAVARCVEELNLIHLHMEDAGAYRRGGRGRAH